MTPDLLLRLAIMPALSLLPPAMTSREAIAMLVAIAWQESEIRARRQQPVGPARGYWQFEAGGAVAGVLRHAATRGHAAALCEQLDVAPNVEAVYRALEYHDVLAAGFARLNLWWLAGPLPTRGARELAWSQYLAAWNPGKPHERRWPQSWAVGWAAVAAHHPQ